MNIRIVLGCITAVSLLMLVPSVPAVEITMVKETATTQMLHDLRTVDLQGLKNYLQTVNQKELRQKIACELFAIDPPRYGPILYLIQYILYNVVNYIAAWVEFIVFWTLAIPQIIALGVFIVLYRILDSLGLVPYYKI